MSVVLKMYSHSRLGVGCFAFGVAGVDMRKIEVSVAVCVRQLDVHRFSGRCRGCVGNFYKRIGCVIEIIFVAFDGIVSRPHIIPVGIAEIQFFSEMRCIVGIIQNIFAKEIYVQS